jgi:hypothetical protein
MIDTIESMRRGLGALSSRAAGIAAAALLAAGLALAQAPSFSGPSIGKVSEAATFNGGALPANAALTIAISGPAGSSSVGTVATAEGTLRYVFSAAQAGAYTLSLQDSGGRTLATAAINVLP